ncbi:MAG: hypothetical protein JWN44_1323 [Myxococcales bacterium]|nr:hypothetical protein [Myxococcales bacterium]
MRAALFCVAAFAAGCSTTPASTTMTVAEQYPTYRALHEAVVTPTCGPRGGVCHNSKQFPDLHTPENMLAVIGARCNQLTESAAQVSDQCEPPGDLLILDGGADAGTKTRIGFVTVDPASPPQWVTLTTHDPIAHDGSAVAFSIVRDGDPKSPLTLKYPAQLATHAGQSVVTISNLPLLGPGMRSFLTTPYMPGYDGELQLGDPNQNGKFGYDMGEALIKPGAPAQSFLVQRILGTVPPRMPLANGDLTADQTYALQCWILQLDPDAANADGPIDYSRCPPQF